MLKLTYFPIPGRGYTTRVCFGLGNIDYVDEHISFSEFAGKVGEEKYCPEMPMGCVPVLTLPNGRVIVESGAISRYAAKRAGLFPTDFEEALVTDEVLELLSSIMSKAPQDKDPQTKKINREIFAAGFLKKAFNLIASRYSSSGGPYLLGKEFNVADISLYACIKMLRSGHFDHVATDYDAQWPQLGAMVTALEEDSKFSKYKL